MEELLRELPELKANVNTVTASNLQLKTKIKSLEEQIKTNNIKKIRKTAEIYGIQQEPNENVKALIIKLAEAANTRLEEGDIKECYRVKRTDGKPGTIKVKFVEAHKKDNYVKAIKGKKTKARGHQ